MDRRDFLAALGGKFAKKQEERAIAINSMECLAWNDVMCYSCKDSCGKNAIDFFASFRPTINSNCDNCGDCASSCPVGAIK
ncbi:MAG: 4Fe-4S binding protein [Helicobacteraceae bacterium]|jgi:ferredoxin-type protein NapF|nr:4Fe-4S binding protein [Helicobacteraceae bacterium]